MQGTTPRHPRRWRSLTVTVGAVAMIALAAPTGAGAAPGYTTSSDPYVALEAGVTGDLVPLINSGETVFGTMFEGIPDGIGVKPANRGHHYIDLYVVHEQSHVPFGGYSDFQDSSVSRVRVDVASKSITGLDEVLSPDAGFIRFCSAFMAGPAEGFAKYTFLVNEESNDILPVPAGAPYGSDPSIAPYRQAGLTGFIDTTTGKIGSIPSNGRFNHENTVVVPGWDHGIVALSGDDTFTFPSTPALPNMSQLYMSRALNANHFIKGDTTLWAFRVTGTDSGPVDATDPFNDANDYLEIAPGMDWSGEFIPVPADVAAGTTSDTPQDAIEKWSNDNNVFQFVRVEDIATDPDSPRTVYFADTGNSRLVEDAGTGRLYRASAGGVTTPGRIFKMELNAADPTKVDSFSVLLEASSIGMRNPDNVAVGHDSLMVQEDTSNAKIWRYDLSAETWTHVATATQPTAETTGITDVSSWFGDGWWALNVQSHVNLTETTGTPFVWTDPPGPAVGTQYQKRLEDGQLLLMRIAGS